MKKNKELDFFFLKKTNITSIFLEKNNILEFFLISFNNFFNHKIKVKKILYFEVDYLNISLIFSLKKTTNDFLEKWDNFYLFFQKELKNTLSLNLEKFGFSFIDE
ncbi:hypothetical protein JTY60_01530 [symbiont of Argiope bruennichi]|uniref:hypothetical protein n=1 Tax=symbiont of Argiope bruennichi TaxID=2810479 RepID=UPI003DA5EDCA